MRKNDRLSRRSLNIYCRVELDVVSPASCMHLVELDVVSPASCVHLVEFDVVSPASCMYEYLLLRKRKQPVINKMVSARINVTLRRVRVTIVAV